ncbi:MAG: hypothetical protein ABIH50_03390 [bacterium]
MAKATDKDSFIIELPKDILKKSPIKDGDWLIVRLLNGKEVVLEKPKKDYWDETFDWGKQFAKEAGLKSSDALKAIKSLRS